MTKEDRINNFKELWDILRDEMQDEGSAEGDVHPSADPQISAVLGQTLLPAAVEESPGCPPRTDRELEAAATDVIELTSEGKKCLADVRKFASWSGPEAEQKLRSAITIFKEQFPGYEADMDDAIAKGKEECKILNTAYKLGGRGTPNSELDSLRASLPEDSSSHVQKKVEKQYKKGLAAHKRHRNEHRRKKRGEKLSEIKVKTKSFAGPSFPRVPIAKDRRNEEKIRIPYHPNDLRGLAPASSWQLIIDETGDTFDENANQASIKRVGRFVGILVPDTVSDLAPLSLGWHAVDCKDTVEIDRVVQSVLDASVGVIGVDVRSLPPAPGERWMDGVGLLIDWVLRLLPVDAPCDVRVKVEQRGSFTAGQSWDLVQRDCLRRLALAYPMRASRIALSIETITKKGSSLNGYVDAVAFSWARTTASSKERIKLSGWVGTCLLESTDGVDVRAMLNAWDAFAQGVNLPEADWWTLVSSSQAANPAAVLSQFLHLVGSEARSSKVVWEKFLREAKSRMSSSPVDLHRLATAVDWLQAYQPDESTMLPALRLAWLTVQLARANHMGKTEQEWFQEFRCLGDRIFEEAAPLVCHADLHLAVAATNRFDFQSAQQCLSRWQDLPVAVPGLRYWGQLRSSMGQHEAFMGNNARAATLFREALECFSRLSDPEMRRVDEAQTGSYLAIALMDDNQVSPEDARDAVEVVTGDLSTAVARLAGSSDPGDRYKHHLLLRWLVHRGDDDTREAYMAQQNEWSTGAGHPWPLIQLYRGMLIRESDPNKALELALDGASRAFSASQGPTVELIGTCCRLVAVGWGVPWPEADTVLDELEKELPMASDRIAELRTAMTARQEPLGLMASVLPFNFR